MLRKFIDIIKNDFPKKTPEMFFLAVSGGADSMTLLDLFYHADLPINVLHCHFGLRDDAYLETKCVMKYCTKRSIPLSCSFFPGQHVKAQDGIQVMCRQWRYQWFGDIISQHPSSVVVTAHHADDNLETLFLNMSRGAGVKGLAGIPKMESSKYRPLLNVRQSELLSYRDENDVPFVDDSSNRDTVYRRNFVRHEVIPLMEERIEAFSEKALHSIQHLNEAKDYISDELGKLKNMYVSEDERGIHLKNLDKWPDFLLKQFLLSYGFNRPTTNDILSTELKIGSLYSSALYDLVVVQNGWHLKKRSAGGDSPMVIKMPGHHTNDTMSLHLSKALKPIQFGRNKNIIHVPLKSLEFPIKLRRWDEGDFIKPLGMEGHRKKVQDVLTDKKVDRLSKQDQLVLVNGDEQIIWVVGHCLSENFKVSDKSKDIVEIKYSESTT